MVLVTVLSGQCCENSGSLTYKPGDNTSYFNEVLFVQTSKKQVTAESICIRFDDTLVHFTPWNPSYPESIPSTAWALADQCCPAAVPLGSHCLLKNLFKHTALHRWWKDRTLNKHCEEVLGGGSALQRPSSVFKTCIFDIPKLEARRRVRDGWVRKSHEEESRGRGPLGWAHKRSVRSRLKSEQEGVSLAQRRGPVIHPCKAAGQNCTVASEFSDTKRS